MYNLAVDLDHAKTSMEAISKLRLTFTATRYLPPYTPHPDPLDPVTFKETMLFTCIRVH